MRISAVDLYLFFRALPPARLAQRVKTTPLDRVVADMIVRRGVSGSHTVDGVARAAARATARWSRWFGGLDTCLTRSLVLGSMLKDREGVALVIGFRSDDNHDAVAGHAWVAVNGRPVGPDSRLADDTYSRLLEVPFSDPSSEKRRER